MVLALQPLMLHSEVKWRIPEARSSLNPLRKGSHRPEPPQDAITAIALSFVRHCLLYSTQGRINYPAGNDCLVTVVAR